jgi:hypothetical protein
MNAGAIVDAVFDGRIPTNTGADHHYAPSGMPGGRPPSWAVVQTPTATIGGQHFISWASAPRTPSTKAIPPRRRLVRQPVAAPGQVGSNNVYANIPACWRARRGPVADVPALEPDPVGNDQKNFAALNPTSSGSSYRVRADNGI